MLVLIQLCWRLAVLRVNPHEMPEHSRIDTASQLEAAAPAISVLIYVDCARVIHLADTLDSMKHQTLHDFEVILIENACGRKINGSTYDRPSFIQSSRFLVHKSQKSLQVPAARKIGLEMCSGEYVFLAESGDLLAPTALEKLYWFLLTHPHHTFAGSYVRVFGAEAFDHPHAFGHLALLANTSIMTVSGLIRRTLFDEVGIFTDNDLRTREDWDFWYRAATLNHTGGTVMDYLVRRRAIELSDSVQRAEYAQIIKYWRYRLKNVASRSHTRMVVLPQVAKLNASAATHEILHQLCTEVQSRGASRPASPRFFIFIPWMEMGGADRFNLQLIRMLAHDGWQVTVVATLGVQHPWWKKFERVTSDVFVLPAFLPTYDDQARFCVHLLTTRLPDIVMVTNSEFGYHILPLLSSVAARLPKNTRLMDYNHMQETYWRQGGYPRDGVNNQHLLDANIVASNDLKQWMVAQGAVRDQIHTCYIGVNSTENQPNPPVRTNVRSRLGIQAHDTVVLYPARLVEQKQPMLFAEIISRLARSAPVTVLVAGDGPYKARFAQKLKYPGPNLKAPRVLYLGAVDVDAMYSVMQASDIVLLPSKMEGIALVAFEAMASGKVFIGADVGGQKELIADDCECGFLIPDDLNPGEKADAYVKVVTRAIENVRLREKIGSAAVARIKTAFDYANMYRCIRDVFEKTSVRDEGQGIRLSVEEAVAESWRRLGL